MRVAPALWVALGLTTAAAAQEPPPATVTTLPHPELPPLDPAPTVVVPTGPRPGFYGGIDFGLIVPHVTNNLRGNVFTPPFFLDEVRLPSAALDATLAPKLTLGYRFGDCGSVAVTYRNIASEGQEVAIGLDPTGESTLFSRVDINEIGVNYSSSEYPLGALWGLRWEVGARLASIFFDSQASGLILGQHTSNHFLGAGPQVALDVTRELPGTGLALFARGDFAEMLGRINQRFAERIGDPAVPFGTGSSSQSGTQAVPYLGLQLGVSWLSHPTGRYRITAGYQFDQWWNAGKLGDSRADVQGNGLFLRSEINF